MCSLHSIYTDSHFQVLVLFPQTLPNLSSLWTPTNWGGYDFSFVVHSSKIKVEWLPSVLIDFKLEILPLVDHLMLVIGN